MKTIPSQLALDSDGTTVSYGLYLKRKDDSEFGFTAHDQSITLDLTAWGGGSAIVFDAMQGLIVTDIVTSSGFEVDNLEITTLDDGTFFDRTELLQGIWNDAAYYVFRYNWNNCTSADEVEVLQRGTVGGIRFGENTFTIELRGLTQRLQQPVGIISTKTCRARLGSTTGPNKCLKDLAAFTYNMTVDAVTNRLTFQSDDAVGSSFPDDWFGEGDVTWTSGANEGVTQKIREFTDDGTFTFVLPMLEDIEVGDTFVAVAGCRKRREDCRDKFDNILNFQGEPDRPLTDDLIKPVIPSA